MNDAVIFRRGEHFLRIIKGRILPLAEDEAGIRLQSGKADLRTVGKRMVLVQEHADQHRLKKDGAVVFAKPEALANTGYATDRSGLSLDAIKDFADSIEIERIRELFERQIRFNMDIASSVPVIVYARETAVPTEKLYRVLTFSRLLTIYQKEFTASCPPSAVRYRHPARRARRSPTLQAARKEPEKVAKAGFTARANLSTHRS